MDVHSLALAFAFALALVLSLALAIALVLAATDMRDGIPVSDLDVTCFALKVFDVLLVVLAFKLAAVAVGPSARAALNVVVSSMGSIFEPCK